MSINRTCPISSRVFSFAIARILRVHLLRHYSILLKIRRSVFSLSSCFLSSDLWSSHVTFQRMRTNRIEAFSDGVIAILITIMVLELKAPHDPTPASLAGMWPTFFAYVLSFIIIAIYWVNHHHLIHLVTTVDSVILWANINLLFWISLIPWVTVYLGDNHALPFPVALYAAVSVAGAISFYLLRASIARHHREPEFKRLNKKMARKNLIAILIYIAAIVVAFIYTPLALVMIALPAMMYFLPERALEKLEHQT